MRRTSENATAIGQLRSLLRSGRCSDLRKYILRHCRTTRAIIAILAAMLLPALKRARDQARQSYCLNNCRQVTIAVMMWVDNSDDYLPSRRIFPEDGTSYTRPGGSTFEYYQKYLKDKYLGGYGALQCPNSNAQFNPKNVWFNGYYSHMAWGVFTDYKCNPIWQNASWGRGHWDAYPDCQMKRGRVVSPTHKIIWMDGVDFYYAGWDKICCGGANFVYYDRNYTRHNGGVNTIMLDGHGEYHKDKELGVGNSCYQHKVKRYWFAYNVEK